MYSPSFARCFNATSEINMKSQYNNTVIQITNFHIRLINMIRKVEIKITPYQSKHFTPRVVRLLFFRTVTFPFVSLSPDLRALTNVFQCSCVYTLGK